MREAIYSHPEVLEAAVIGVPDAKSGEAVRAVVVLKEGQFATAEDIVILCRKNLAGCHVPKSVEFTKSLPRMASGKIAMKKPKVRYHA